MHLLYGVLLLFSVLHMAVRAQYPPAITGVYEINSPSNPGVIVRFKKPDSSICRTANATQKQYSGYIVSDIPGKVLGLGGWRLGDRG